MSRTGSSPTWSEGSGCSSGLLLETANGGHVCFMLGAVRAPRLSRIAG